jgi:hypothetical protein
MSYTPTSNAVIVDGPYTTTTAAVIGWDEGSISLTGIAGAAYGDVEVRNAREALGLSGFDAQALGGPNVAIPGYIGLSGFDAQALGAGGWVSNYRRYLGPGGFDAQAIGAGFVAYWVRRLELTGVLPPDPPMGVPLVGTVDRPLPPAGLDAQAVGSARVSYRESLVQPRPFVGMRLGTPMLGFTRGFDPEGFDGLAFGRLEVLDNTQRIRPTGPDFAAFGPAELTRSPRVIGPSGFAASREDIWPNERFGPVFMDRNPRPIAPVFDVLADGQGVGESGRIENRNKTLRPPSLSGMKFGAGLLVIRGPVIAPAGFAADEFGRALVARGIRSLALEGFDAALLPLYAALHNAAAMLRPASLGDTQRIGRPGLVNTRRWLTYAGGDDQQVFGAAWIDYGERTIAPLFPPTSLPVPEPRIGYALQPLEPAGWVATAFGGCLLEEHFTIIQPHGFTAERLGEPEAVRNLTPELSAYGHDSGEFGRAGVGLWRRFVAPEGHDQSRWGTHAIGDRARWLSLAPMGPPPLGMGFELQNLSEDPVPTLQAVNCPSLDSAELGRLDIQERNLHPAGFAADEFGAAALRLMGITRVGGIYLREEDQYGAFAVLGAQYVVGRGIAADEQFIGEPQISPSTLAPTSILPMGDADRFRQFGIAALAHRHRPLPASGFASAALGEAFRVDLLRRVLPLQGFRSQRFGVPRCLGTLWPVGFESSAVGDAEVAFPATGPRIIEGGGFDWAEFGGAAVENQDRAIGPEPIESGEFGAARLHPPEPMRPDGFEATVFGPGTWIAYRVQALPLDGFDAQAIDATPGYFKDRMRVLRGQPLFLDGFRSSAPGVPKVSHSVQAIGAKGFDAAKFSSPRVSLHTQQLRAYSVPHWTDPPTRHSVKSVKRVGFEGIDLSTVGQTEVAHE